MITTTRTISVILACLLITSCGGGNGNGNSGGTSTSTPSFYAALSSAAQNRPSFGSVTQSSNYDSSGSGSNSRITTDSTSTTFDGTNLSVTINREDKNPIRFDGSGSITDSRGSEHRYTIPKGTTSWHIPAHKTVGQHYWDITSDSITLGTISVSWDETDTTYTDYFAGGYWLHVRGDIEDEEIISAEVGAFMDGRELDVDATTSLPDTVTGSATYTGAAAGLYVHRGQGVNNAFDGTLGEYTAPLTLNANFDSDTITACLGCSVGTASGVTINRFILTGRGAAPDPESPEPEPLDAEMRMTASTINSNGTFVGTDMSFQLEGQDVPVSGNWGGKFSNKLDTTGDGRPRLVAGTNAAEINFGDGSTVSLVGAFFGIK